MIQYIQEKCMCDEDNKEMTNKRISKVVKI